MAPVAPRPVAPSRTRLAPVPMVVPMPFLTSAGSSSTAQSAFSGSTLTIAAGGGVVGVGFGVVFVVVGVGPRTLGRQHAERIALASALPAIVLTRLLGPLPQLLILLGNALTPGKGFREGPFASEVEVRELVDLAAASSLIESESAPEGGSRD